MEGTFTSLPFGDGLTTASGTDTDAYHFATVDHDYETDTEHAQFRQYSSAQGRFLSPDPYGGSYDPSNPQSFNRYVYVMNNPLGAADPSGLVLCDYGSSDLGGEDYEDDEEGDADCEAGGGNPVNTPPITVTVNANGASTISVDGIVINTSLSSNAPNNGRYCTTAPANVSQRLAAAAQTTAMTAQFFSGLGPSNLTFGPDSATSLVMGQSGPVDQVLSTYYQSGQTSGLYTFGLSGLVSAGVNPVAQFVGSFRWTITPTSGGINLSLTNTTSFKSLTYDQGPQWQRSVAAPMGNTHQTFNISAACL